MKGSYDAMYARPNTIPWLYSGASCTSMHLAQTPGMHFSLAAPVLRKTNSQLDFIPNNVATGGGLLLRPQRAFLMRGQSLRASEVLLRLPKHTPYGSVLVSLHAASMVLGASGHCPLFFGANRIVCFLPCSGIICFAKGCVGFSTNPLSRILHAPWYWAATPQRPAKRLWPRARGAARQGYDGFLKRADNTALHDAHAQQPGNGRPSAGVGVGGGYGKPTRQHQHCPPIP